MDHARADPRARRRHVRLLLRRRRPPAANAYTYLPQIWAAGGDVIDYTTHQATMVSDPVVKEAFQYYKTMWDEGLMPEGAKAEDGSTWQTTFATGNIGIQPLGGGWGIRGVIENNPDLNFGVTALPGKEAGQCSSFAGGDTIAVSSSAQNVDAAWEFIEWTLSDDVQTEIYAKNGAFTSRTDLADNKYADGRPARWWSTTRRSPTARRRARWATTRSSTTRTGRGSRPSRRGIFGGDLDGALQAGNDGIQSILDSHYQ